MIDRDRVEKVVRDVLRESEAGEPLESSASSRSVAIGSDHGGFALKEMLRAYLADELGDHVVDVGTHDDAPCDYPDYALKVADAVASGCCERGIMIDGAGIGSSMAANRVPGVLAACCHDVRTVLNSREHNCANVLTLGAGIVGRGLARQMVRVWLETEFGGGRHERRVKKILDLERRWTEKSS